MLTNFIPTTPSGLHFYESKNSSLAPIYKSSRSRRNPTTHAKGIRSRSACRSIPGWHRGFDALVMLCDRSHYSDLHISLFFSVTSGSMNGTSSISSWCTYQARDLPLRFLACHALYVLVGSQFWVFFQYGSEYIFDPFAFSLRIFLVIF